MEFPKCINERFKNLLKLGVDQNNELELMHTASERSVDEDPEE